MKRFALFESRRRDLDLCLIALIGTLLAGTLAAGTASAQQLFVGLEDAGLVTRSTDLAGFPDVTYSDHYAFEVSGAAATPDGDLYLCNGAFTTRLYRATLTSPPVQLSTLAVDASALAYGRGTLWGYSNYATPKGIYAFEPSTGAATLVLDVYTGTGFRFFALDYDPFDDLLYGYTEYGDSGLYSINIDTGEMVRLAGTIPASNGQGRGMAVGNHTVYLTATRGDDLIPQFAYDLSQGPGGSWVGFTNPYPDHHSTGGAAWIPGPQTGVGQGGAASTARITLLQSAPNPMRLRTSIRFELPAASEVGLAIYTVNGQRVSTLLDRAALGSGPHRFDWNGTDDGGRPVAAGIYFYRLEAGPFETTRKIVLTR